jgi:hypothetical protein
MVSAHPGYSGIIMTHVLALVNLYGWDYFRDLSKNSLHLVQSANDPAGVVASGERPVGVNGAEYFYYKTQKQGNPITIIYPKEGCRWWSRRWRFRCLIRMRNSSSSLYLLGIAALADKGTYAAIEVLPGRRPSSRLKFSAERRA